MTCHLNHPDPLKKRAPALALHALAALLLIANGAAAQTPEPSLPYTVKPSDKLIVLAKEMLNKPTDWNEVAKFNHMKDPNFIKPGQKLDIPLRLLKARSLTGTLVSAEGEVRLGSAPAATGSPVPEGSRLQTGPNSSAVVQLSDGSQVKLLPGTLAEVVTQRDYAVRDASASGSTTWFSGLIRLTMGALETLASKTTNRASPLQIETPTSLVGVRGTQFRVAYEDPATQNARTEVMEGLVRADNPAQQSGADLPRGTGAVINPAQKEVKVVTLLAAPALDAAPAEVLQPQALWPLPALQGASAFRVQVASDERFDKIVRDLKAGGSGSVALPGLANGNWYLRVRGIDAQGLEGFDAVKLIAVKDGRWQVINTGIRVLNGDTLLSFGSSSSSPFTTIEAELALDADFTRPVRKATLTTPLWNLGTLGGATYYVRFKAVDASGSQLPSETYRFELPGNWGITVFDVSSPLQRVD